MTAPPTIDGYPVVSATVRETVSGAWVADFVSDSEEVPTGQVELVIDGASFVGTARDVLVDNGKVTGRLVAGAGSMSSESDAGEVVAKTYTGVSLQTVLADVLRLSGERLSSTSATLSDHFVRNWQRSRGPYKRAVDALAAKAGLTWRMLRDGTLWLGTDAWAAADEAGIEEVSAEAADGYFDLREAISIAPGVTYQGKRIVQTTHSISKSGTQTEAWTKSAQGSLNQLKELLRREADFDRLWGCQVISQRSDYSLELLADDERIRGTGHDRVLIAPGVPGTRVQVPAGARCYIEFAGGDPSMPRVTAWDAETTLTLLTIGDAASAQFVALANLVAGELAGIKSQLDDVVTDFNIHVHPAGTPNTGPPTISHTNSYSPSSVAATKLKAE